MAKITKYEGIDLIAVNANDLKNLGMTVFEFLDKTSGFYVGASCDSKEFFNVLGVSSQDEYYICLFAELGMKIGNDTITSIAHHEIGHIKLGHVEESRRRSIEQGILGTPVNIQENELAADAYAANIVGRKRMLRDVRRIIIGSLALMTNDFAHIRRASRRIFSVPDLAERLEALGGVDGRHFYKPHKGI